MPPRSRNFRLFVLLAAVPLGVMACSSSATSTGGASSSTLAGGDSSAASANSAATAAGQAVTQLEARPTTLSMPALPSKPPTGKQVDVIACGLPICQQYAAADVQAAAAVGWTSKTLQAGLTPQGVAAAYDQAVRDKPAGVIGLGGFSPTLFSHQLTELAAEHVPMVVFGAYPYNLPGITWAGGLDQAEQTKMGTELADYIINDAHGQVIHAAIVTTPATPYFAMAHGPFINTIKADCSACTVDTYSFAESDIGTTLPADIVTYLTTHPDVNYLFFDFNNEVDGVPAALKTAGLASRVKIVMEDTSPTESAYIASGEVAASAGLAFDEGQWEAWNLFLRNAMGLPLGPAENFQLPNWIITKSNLPSTTSAFPVVADYQDLFKAAWHVP
jgi:ribose transport system substrate-binding protein